MSNLPQVRKIERVSPLEVYQLNTSGERVLRICGSTATFSGKICYYTAGWRTKHLGQGYCWLHETPESTSIWNIMLGDSTKDSTLVRYLTSAASITDSQLMDLRSDILMMYAILASVQEGKQVLTSGDIDLIRKIVADIGKLKDIKIKSDKEIRLEVNAVKNFINQVFSIIVTNVDKVTARRVMNQILEKVVLPMENTNQLDGNASEIHDLARDYDRAAKNQLKLDKKSKVNDET